MTHLNASAVDPMAMYVAVFQGLCIQARRQGNRAALSFLGQYLSGIMDDDALDAFRDQLRAIVPDGSPPGFNHLLALIGDEPGNAVAKSPPPPLPEPPAKSPEPPSPPRGAPTPANVPPSRIPAPMW